MWRTVMGSAVAAAMQSAAQNQQTLRPYAWIEKVEMSFGDTCRTRGRAA